MKRNPNSQPPWTLHSMANIKKNVICRLAAPGKGQAFANKYSIHEICIYIDIDIDMWGYWTGAENWKNRPSFLTNGMNLRYYPVWLSQSMGKHYPRGSAIVFFHKADDCPCVMNWASRSLDASKSRQQTWVLTEQQNWNWPMEQGRQMVCFIFFCIETVFFMDMHAPKFKKTRHCFSIWLWLNAKFYMVCSKLL